LSSWTLAARLGLTRPAAYRPVTHLREPPGRAALPGRAGQPATT